MTRDEKDFKAALDDHLKMTKYYELRLGKMVRVAESFAKTDDAETMKLASTCREHVVALQHHLNCAIRYWQWIQEQDRFNDEDSKHERHRDQSRQHLAIWSLRDAKD